MTHKITVNTVEVLLLTKALRLDMQNEVDNAMAEKLIDRILLTVEKDIKQKKPTDLTNKCGSCVWAKPHYRGTQKVNCYIDCTCPSKNPNWFARTNKCCRFYEQKGAENDRI